MNLTPRHCPYCQNKGCDICHSARMAEIERESLIAEAKEFHRAFLRAQNADPNTPLDHNTLVIIIEAIRYGKEVARGENRDSEAANIGVRQDRFAMLEFERITLIPQRAEEPPWRDRRKSLVV